MDLDYKNLPLSTEEYNNCPINKNGYYLKFIIESIRSEATRERIGPDDYVRFDNEIIYEKNESNKYVLKTSVNFYLGVAAIFGILFPLVMWGMEWKYVLILEAIAVFFCYVAYRYYKKFQITPDYDHIIFDRLAGEITLPEYFRKYHFKIPFKELKAQIRKINGGATPGGISGTPDLYFNLLLEKGLGKVLNFVSSTILFTAQESWSFFVWYMDRNRPLPPDEVFDPYRQEDFERRKIDGFPPPLYKSCIPTPEATPEQQLLREAFWKDENYIVDPDEAYYNPLDIRDIKKQQKARKTKETSNE